MRRSIAILLLEVACLCLVIQGVANAQDDFEKKRGGPQWPTVQELMFLPPYCTTRYTWGKVQAETEEVKRWRNILGGAFIHVHHYCNGLNFLNRITRGVGDRQVLLGLAQGEFKYIQNNVPADNVLRPEVEFNMGLVLYKADRIPQAIGQFQKAILMNPNYEQAYLLLSFGYLRLGDRTSAADALQKGLTRVPNSRALRDALNEMNSTKKEPDAGGNR